MQLLTVYSVSLWKLKYCLASVTLPLSSTQGVYWCIIRSIFFTDEMIMQALLGGGDSQHSWNPVLLTWNKLYENFSGWWRTNWLPYISWEDLAWRWLSCVGHELKLLILSGLFTTKMGRILNSDERTEPQWKGQRRCYKWSNFICK